MLGYWKNEKETNKVLKDGGYILEILANLIIEFLKITDRKKDIIITPGGDNISPIKIENDLIKLNFIEQSLVYGDNKPYLVSLISNTLQKSLTNEEIKKEIKKVNKNLIKR